jgi:hypothetical protein
VANVVVTPDLLSFSTSARRTPSIIELSFRASERITQFGSSPAIVAMLVSLETYPEVKTSAASLLCRPASSRSNSTSGWLVPEMFPSASRASAHADSGSDHGADHPRVLTHTEVVVRAPDHDRARAVRRMPCCVRETAGHALEIGKHAVVAFGMQASKSRGKEMS